MNFSTKCDKIMKTQKIEIKRKDKRIMGEENKKKFIIEYKANVPDNTCNGECSMCGKCCGNGLGVNMEDIQRIDRYLKTHNVAPTEVRLLRGIDNIEVESCPFLGEDNKCKIYDARPTICRKFICNAEKMFEQYDENGELVKDEIGQVDIRKTFF